MSTAWTRGILDYALPARRVRCLIPAVSDKDLSVRHRPRNMSPRKRGADDPVNIDLSNKTETSSFTGCPAFARYDESESRAAGVTTSPVAADRTGRGAGGYCQARGRRAGKRKRD